MPESSLQDPLLILGLAPDASLSQIEEAARSLKERLVGLQDQRSQKVLESIERALTAIEGGQPGSAATQERLNSRLRLGHLCLASGMISIEQLAEAMELQKQSTNADVPLGEILQERQFISQEELDGLLIAQDLIEGVEECTDQEALRLLAMDLLTEEMVAISLLEKRFASSSLAEVLARRGWLSQELFEAIFKPSL